MSAIGFSSLSVFRGFCLGGWGGAGNSRSAAGAGSAVEGLEVAAQDQVGEFAVACGGADAREFAGVIAPRLVAGEQQAVLADPAPLDLLHQPARREAHGPTGVGIDLLAGLDPVE